MGAHRGVAEPPPPYRSRRHLTPRSPHVVLATAPTHPALTPSDALLRDAIEARGARVTALPWDRIPPGAADGWLVVLRSTWDYHLRPAEFRRWVESWNGRSASFWNPPVTVLWNLDKFYLQELAEGGIRLPPTRWFEPGQRPNVDGFLAASGARRAVLKPRISATAMGTRLVGADDALSEAELAPLLASGSIVQAFVPEIETHGELSLVFIAGSYSHAVRKRPAPGDFRVQSEFGGRTAPHAASRGERAFGEAVLAALPHAWLYARVDIVAAGQGPVLMELELIEPALFLDADTGAASRLAEAILDLSRGAG